MRGFVAGKAKPSDLGRYRRGEFFAGCADSVACVGNLSAIIFQYAGCGVIAVVGEIRAVGKNLNPCSQRGDRCGVCIADGQRFAVGLQGLRRKGRAILLRDEQMVFVRACGNGGKRKRNG